MVAKLTRKKWERDGGIKGSHNWVVVRHHHEAPGEWFFLQRSCCITQNINTTTQVYYIWGGMHTDQVTLHVKPNLTGQFDYSDLLAVSRAIFAINCVSVTDTQLLTDLTNDVLYNAYKTT